MLFPSLDRVLISSVPLAALDFFSYNFPNRTSDGHVFITPSQVHHFEARASRLKPSSLCYPACSGSGDLLVPISVRRKPRWRVRRRRRPDHRHRHALAREAATAARCDAPVGDSPTARHMVFPPCSDAAAASKRGNGHARPRCVLRGHDAQQRVCRLVRSASCALILRRHEPHAAGGRQPVASGGIVLRGPVRIWQQQWVASGKSTRSNRPTGSSVSHPDSLLAPAPHRASCMLRSSDSAALRRRCSKVRACVDRRWLGWV